MNGQLEGVIREYYQKDRMRGMGRRGAIRQARSAHEAARGPIKAEWTYLGGKRNGPYRLYYENGFVKEEGVFRDDKYFGRILKYSKKGYLTSKKYYEFAE